MKLHYRNTVDDLVAFNRFFFQRSPLLKQQARGAAVVIVVLFLIGALLISMSARGGRSIAGDEVLDMVVGLGIGIVPMAIVAYLVYQPIMLYNVCSNTRKIYQLHPDSTLGDQELEVMSGQLVARNELSTAFWKFSAIDEIATTPQYVFIRVSGSRAFILPRREIAEPELGSFVAELERQRRAPVEVSPPQSSPSEAIQVDKSSIQL